MTTVNSPQFEGLKDVAASAISNTFDAYGWAVLNTLFVALILGVMLLLICLSDFDSIDFDNLGVIFCSVRDSWRKKTTS